MKLNTNIQWGEFEKRGFFKINSRIVEVCDLSLETQQEYWRLINKNKNNLDSLYYKFKSDENFNKFFSFIRMLGGIEDGINEWTCFEKKYKVNLHNLDKDIKKLKISVFGEPDLKNIAMKELSKQFEVVEDVGGFGILIGRKENILSLLEYNRRLISENVPFLTILMEPFGISLGPLTVPHMTPCLNCIISNKGGSQLENDLEYNKILAALPDGKEKIPLITIDIALKIAEIQVLKYLIRKERNQNSLRLVNNVLEYDLYNDSIVWHPVVKDICCDVCQKISVNSDKWLNIGE